MKRLIRKPLSIPPHHRANFRHLYGDMAWFGVLNGSFIAFAAVYLTRIGASATQLGWFAAIPALMALVISLPAGLWLKTKKLDRTVFWASAWFRLYYLLWLALLFWVPTAFQINIVLFLTVVLSVPGTILAISFNALFATIVPREWRNHVIGIRQALLAIASVIATMTCGYLLNTLPLQVGYKLVFGIASVAGVMSSLHLWFIEDGTARSQTGSALNEARKRKTFNLAEGLRFLAGLRSIATYHDYRLPRLTILQGNFGRAMIVIFFMFLALYVANPLYYPYWVAELGYSDLLISIGTALFYTCQFLAATQLPTVSRWLGNQKALGVGAAMLSAYPGITAISPHPAAYIVSSIVSGIGWGIAGGAILAYLLDSVPDTEHSRYMAWYSLLTNLAILIGSLLGPLVGALVGFRLGLGIAAFLRVSSGLLIWFFGAIDVDLTTTDQVTLEEVPIRFDLQPQLSPEE